MGPLEKDFAVDAENPVRTLKASEVLELIEGPRQETLASVMRCKATASEDGKVGWFTMKDQKGADCVEKDEKHYTCTAIVAITDNLDIKECKVLRKLAIDEVFVVIEGPIEADNGMRRVKGKTTKDEIGWITIKGNAGTTYAKMNDKLHTVTKAVSLHEKFGSESPVVRDLTVGEAIQITEGPREEKPQPITRVKVCTSTDRVVGWISKRADNVRAWTPFYKVLKSTPLYTSNGSKESSVREVISGEVLELLEGPIDIDGHMWLKAQAKKDGSVGWTPVQDDGVKLLQGQ